MMERRRNFLRILLGTATLAGCKFLPWKAPDIDFSKRQQFEDRFIAFIDEEEPKLFTSDSVRVFTFLALVNAIGMDKIQEIEDQELMSVADFFLKSHFELIRRKHRIVASTSCLNDLQIYQFGAFETQPTVICLLAADKRELEMEVSLVAEERVAPNLKLLHDYLIKKN